MDSVYNATVQYIIQQSSVWFCLGRFWKETQKNTHIHRSHRHKHWHTSHRHSHTHAHTDTQSCLSQQDWRRTFKRYSLDKHTWSHSFVKPQIGKTLTLIKRAFYSKVPPHGEGLRSTPTSWAYRFLTHSSPLNDPRLEDFKAAPAYLVCLFRRTQPLTVKFKQLTNSGSGNPSVISINREQQIRVNRVGDKRRHFKRSIVAFEMGEWGKGLWEDWEWSQGVPCTVARLLGVGDWHFTGRFEGDWLKVWYWKCWQD